MKPYGTYGTYRYIGIGIEPLWLDVFNLSFEYKYNTDIILAEILFISPCCFIRENQPKKSLNTGSLILLLLRIHTLNTAQPSIKPASSQQTVSNSQVIASRITRI